MGTLRGTYFLAVLILLITNGYSLPTRADEVRDYRLPKTVKPERYEIELTVGADFATTKKFSGSVKITVKADVETSTIVMNSANITYLPSDEYQIAEDTSVEKITVTLVEPLTTAASRTLTFTYEGILHEDMYGFYISSYKDDGVDDPEWIATTQFQGTYARRAFPCFDEPEFKAIFELTLKRPAAYNTLSNTKLSSSVDVDGVWADKYTPTPLMSSYLVAFVVSKFKGYGETHTELSTEYDVYCREQALETAKYAYDTGSKVLNQLKEYTSLDYYLNGIDKMHQVAIPDFAAGAMENWGLVTYRETALLWDENESTASYKQRVATVIAHEFAHMWFGDLVTLQWWSYTWLNEGFARYLQYVITKDIEVHWELENQFVVEVLQSIFVSDAISSAFALNSEALSPSEISDKFASISYNKGASVIRMMHLIIGETDFMTGIRKYLSDNQHKNTVPSDLWSALQAGLDEERLPGVDFSTVMKNWTDLAGFPLVTVTMSGANATLKQERFLFDQTQSKNTEWYVPITYTTSHSIDFNKTTTSWLKPGEILTIPNILHGGEGWVVVNLQQKGYYRVNYDATLWSQLETALKSTTDREKIDVLNRAQIVDDLFNLARAGIVKYATALDITSYLVNETEYYPWYSAFSSFSFIRKRRGDYEQLTEHIITMMDKLYKSVSFDISNESHLDILKTALAIDWACSLEVENCVTKSDELFTAYMDNTTTNKINPNIRSTVYCSALRRETGSEKWNFLWNIYKETTLAGEQNIILSALGCSKNEDVLTEYLRMSIKDGSGIRKQDARSVFNAVLGGNLNNVNIAFKFLQDNFSEIASYYGGMNDLSSIITNIADRFTTQEQIDALVQFATEHEEDLKDAAHQIENALETAKANLKWAQDDLDTWLKDTYGSAASITFHFSLFLVVVFTIVNNLM